MPTRKLSRISNSQGQSLVETALMIPLLLVLILNAVNFGYFLLVTLNLTSAARNGIEYAIQGSSAVANSSLPQATGTPAKTVSSLISQELSSFNSGTLAVQVCSLNLGSGSGSAPTSSCTTSPPSSGGQFALPHSDPESANGFALNRIDVSYTFNTLIPTAAFNLVVGSFPTCNLNGSCIFTRHAEMRAMGS
jgi:Flp pilus assembly protein TadG